MSTQVAAVVGASAGLVFGLLLRPALSLIGAAYERLNDGQGISGTYGIYDSVSNVRFGRATIVQCGKKIRIISTRQVNRNQKQFDRQRQFVYRGRYIGGILVAVYRDQAAAHRIGAVALKSINGNRELAGKSLYAENDTVEPFPFTLRLMEPTSKALKGITFQRVLLIVLD